MSLHFTLCVNGRSIGGCSIERQGDPEAATTADSVASYRVEVEHFASPQGLSGGRQNFTVQHRIGDGPWSLVATAMQRVSLGSEGNAR